MIKYMILFLFILSYRVDGGSIPVLALPLEDNLNEKIGSLNTTVQLIGHPELSTGKIKGMITGGSPECGLRLLIPKDFPWACGTVSFWTYLIDWSYKDTAYNFLRCQFFLSETDLVRVDTKKDLLSILQILNYQPMAHGKVFRSSISINYSQVRKATKGPPFVSFDRPVWTTHALEKMGGWNVGSWHLITVTWNHSGHCVLFKDGEKQGFNNHATLIHFPEKAAVIIDLGQPRNWRQIPDKHSSIYDFRLYDKELTEDEVGELYAAGMEKIQNEQK